jgi:hypothetical protein
MFIVASIYLRFYIEVRVGTFLLTAIPPKTPSDSTTLTPQLWLNLWNTTSKFHTTVTLLLANLQIHTECASMFISSIHIQFHMPCSSGSSVITMEMKAIETLYTTAMLLLFIVQKLHIFSMTLVSRNRIPIYNIVLIENKGLTLMAQFATSIKRPTGHRHRGCLHYILHCK